jgi:hypothetical protein
MLKILIFFSICILTGCAAAPYKKADLSLFGGRQGYLDKQIAPGRYVLEYSHIGGYNYNLKLNKQYWARRASELCPNGYEGAPEVIFAGNAKIKEFVCPQNFCANYPLVSGVIQCKE